MKIIGRVLVAIPIIAIQVLWFVILFTIAEAFSEILMIALQILAFLFSLYIISKRDEGTYKILWLLVIMTLPWFGAFLYLIVGNKGTGVRLRKKLAVSTNQLEGVRPKNATVLKNLEKEDKRVAQSLKHISETTGFPLYKCNDTTYYPLGENMFKDMCEELQKAEKFVFIEYFIMKSGKFWDTMVDILEKKAAQGVDVRVMYDDVGSIGTYSHAEVAKLKAKGIKCIAFNPFFALSVQLNNRDHRKMMIIDGRVAFSGGVNIADEYINEVVHFGHWKDIGFRINGESVKSYTYMFVEFWNAFEPKDPIQKELINAYDYSKILYIHYPSLLPYYNHKH